MRAKYALPKLFLGQKRQRGRRKRYFFVDRRIIVPLNAHTYPMIKPTKNIQDVKQMVKAYDHKRVAVKVNLGRNKSVQFCGVVGGVYPALFTVRPDKSDFLGKTAYSYADVLCGAVSLKLLP
jgi:uncharacterized protein Veg